MNRFDRNIKRQKWFVPFLISVFIAGCGGNGGQGSILGADAIVAPPGGVIVASPGAIIPGAVCPIAGPTIPTVTMSNPTSGNLVVTTSTNGVANGGKLITATFSLAMNPATINASSFILAPVGGFAVIPASVTYNVATKVATFTTPSALQANTSYTALVLGSVTSATGTPMGCDYAWNFKTAAVAATGLAAINLGLATPFAIAATAGISNTLTVPITHINGDVVLNPTATCNAVGVDNIGGFGLCGGSPPVIVGTVITPTYPDTTTANSVQASLRAAYLSITPPAGPPAAGSLSGGTPIAAPTGLGAVTGSALVVGQNLFFPGVYQSITSLMVANDLTLDAQGDPNAVFVFQSSSTVGAAAGAASPGVHTRILLINGAKASNVWWQAGTSATLGTNADWNGNILASSDITMTTGATSCGRLFAGAFTAGAFVFDSNVVSVPGNLSAPPLCQ
ncbi:MAG: ice-binding family protein [Burkholderiaceae bacterium]